MLEHLPNPLQAVFEIRRVLKPGGQLLLVLPWKDATFDRVGSKCSQCRQVL
jgi:ubiquinone/menaquinone biosynthesis C-methylase UbiE